MKTPLIIAFLFISNAAHAKDYIFIPSRVIDGDTIEIQEQAFGLKLTIRVDGIDTPEKGSRAKCESENQLALKASAFTKKFIEGSKISVSKLRWDKYGGRMLGDVRVGKKYLSRELIDRGLAREYHGERKKSWCE